MAVVPPTYQNTPEGRSSYLQKFQGNDWYNGPLFDSYLTSHPDWTDNVPYWDKRLGDRPGTGSNLPETPKVPYQSRRSQMTPTGDQGYGYGDVAMPETAPPQSGLMQQIMAELTAQQQGQDSPLTRNTHLKMLRGQ